MTYGCYTVSSSKLSSDGRFLATLVCLVVGTGRDRCNDDGPFH